MSKKKKKEKKKNEFWVCGLFVEFPFFLSFFVVPLSFYFYFFFLRFSLLFCFVFVLVEGRMKEFCLSFFSHRFPLCTM